jgi:RNA polymerase sigma-70 factor (ECF subfamily)
VRNDIDENDLSDISASLSGGEGAYARIVRRYEGEILRQMSHYTKNRDDLRELSQQVFVEAYRSLPRYRPDAPFLHWLRRIASRVGYRYWTIQRRDRERFVPLDDWRERVLANPPESQSPSDAAELLFELLERLSAKDRLVLTLMYFEECDVGMIAERMGWSRTLVKVRAFRARKKLRAMLEAAGHWR